MLVQLSIRDIVLIDRLDIEPGPGLTVLTGETGAGKSILLDAFSLALGGRGDGGLVRAGQAQGQVTAAFDLPAGIPLWRPRGTPAPNATATSSCAACRWRTGARALSSTISP